MDVNAWAEHTDKAIFDIRPTNPQVDILPTGKCEAHIREVYIMIPSPKPSTTTPTSPPDPEQPISADNRATIPSGLHLRWACMYDIECLGMMSTELFHALYKSFTIMQRAKHHTCVQPPPIDMATELAGMMVSKQHGMSPTNK